MDNASLSVVIYVVVWLLVVIISLWILWAIIRGAVLSALRKHAYETRQLESIPIATGAVDLGPTPRQW